MNNDDPHANALALLMSILDARQKQEWNLHQYVDVPSHLYRGICYRIKNYEMANWVEVRRQWLNQSWPIHEYCITPGYLAWPLEDRVATIVLLARHREHDLRAYLGC